MRKAVRRKAVRKAVRRKVVRRAVVKRAVRKAVRRRAIVGMMGGEGRRVELKRQKKASIADHAGMEAEDRTRAQHRFMEGEVEVVVATNAFGMGVDKANVRSVWHMAIPTSL